MKNRSAYLAAALLIAGVAAACRPEASRVGQHHDPGVSERGDRAMGFSHAKTTHHFRLLRDGGVIEAEANDPRDEESRDQIKRHMRHIAEKFSEGDFTAPMFIHGQTPPGVPAMKRLKAEIEYQFEETERGGRVRIRTNNAEALAAAHDFLRFQINEHKTGDSSEVGG